MNYDNPLKWLLAALPTYIEPTDLADLSRQIGEQNTTIGYQDAMLAQRDAELTLLRELAADVARWRETGGDPRDLGYIIETADKYEAMKARDG